VPYGKVLDSYPLLTGNSKRRDSWNIKRVEFVFSLFLHVLPMVLYLILEVQDSQ